MRTLRMLAVGMFVAGALAGWAHAGTVYVSPSGSDISGSGTSGGPYRTVQKGINMALAGDTVLVAAGTYNENISFLGKTITVSGADPDTHSVIAATITDGALYWRLEGRSKSLRTLYGPTRVVYFDCGNIPTMGITPSHTNGADEAVWPVVSAVHTFYWADATQGMKYFYIDISKSAAIPITDRKSTITIGKRGIIGATYSPTAAEWKSMRLLATWLKKPRQDDPAEGVLYWRVRAQDADKTVGCTSAVKKLVMDGGTWTVSDLNLSAPLPTLSWAHTGDGIEKYGLEFCVNDEFEPMSKETLKVPARSLTAPLYTLSAAEVRKLKSFAARNYVTMPYYRVRGENAQKAFITYSPAETVAAP